MYMLDCFMPEWIYLLFDMIDGKELVTALNWLYEKGIIHCNEII